MLPAMKRILAIALAVALPFGCKPVEKKVAVNPNYEKEIHDWQTHRAERLKAEDGWLSLAGLYWLQEGENRFGSDRANDRVIFPARIAADAGVLTMKDGHVTLDAHTPMTIGGKPVAATTPLLDDSDPNGPTIVQIGTVRFQIIKRGPRYGVRIKDPEAETRTKFKGLDYFPIDPKWRVEAKFEPYNPTKKIPITDVTGMTSDSDSPGALVFSIDDHEYRIDPILEDPKAEDLFIIVKDATSRDTTYQPGRYLYVKRPGPDGKVIVDFNKLYNPPCAFTDFATCPLPPKQNVLPIRIEAGEKRYAGGHHA